MWWSSARTGFATSRRPAIGLVAALLGVFILSGCGFQPVYRQNTGSNGAQDGATVAQLASIRISPISDRVGQILRNALRDRLTPLGRPSTALYRLDVSLTENRSNLVIQQDATSTFAKLRLQARYALVNIATDQPLTRGTSENTTIFNIVESEFANLSAERDAKRRAAIEISDDIRLRLALFLGAAPPQ
jgi:LPS-assembly lipoprotein